MAFSGCKHLKTGFPVTKSMFQWWMTNIFEMKVLLSNNFSVMSGQIERKEIVMPNITLTVAEFANTVDHDD